MLMYPHRGKDADRIGFNEKKYWIKFLSFKFLGKLVVLYGIRVMFG